MAKEEKKLSLAEAKKLLEKTYGKGAIIHGDEIIEVKEVVSTGSLQLDIALGTGGIPVALSSESDQKGKIIELFGWESSGKSTITQNIMANAQKKGITCMLVDAENSLEKEYAETLGIDLEKLWLIQLDEGAGEAAYDKMEVMAKTGEIQLVIVDSYNALRSKKEIEGSIENTNMGLHAKLTGNAVAKANNLCISENATFIFIGQLREKIGVMFGSPEVTQGGNALKFYSHIRMKTSRSLTTDNSQFNSDKEKVANLHKVEVIKNKMARPFRKAEFTIVYGQGIDKYNELIDTAHEYKIGKLYGKAFTYDGTKYDTEDFINLLQDNDVLFEEIRNKILEAALPKNVKKDTTEEDSETIEEDITQEDISKWKAEEGTKTIEDQGDALMVSQIVEPNAGEQILSSMS